MQRVQIRGLRQRFQTTARARRRELQLFQRAGRRLHVLGNRYFRKAVGAIRQDIRVFRSLGRRLAA